MTAMSVTGVDDDVCAVGADTAKGPVDDFVARSDAKGDQRAFMEFAEFSEERLSIGCCDVSFGHGFNVALTRHAA